MILVDDIVRGMKGSYFDRWCHMTSDMSEEELHAFAEKLGLKRRWFQSHPTHPHYDISPAKRKEAIRRGAVSVTGKELVMRCYGWKTRWDVK